MSQKESPCNMTFCALLNEYLNYRRLQQSGQGVFAREADRNKEIMEELNNRCPYRPID